MPLWIAGTLSARNLDRLVRYGDAWIPIMGETVEGIAAGAKRARDGWTEAGRDADRLQVQAPVRIARGDDNRPDIARSMESVPELLAAGATDVHVSLQAYCRDPDAAPAALDAIVTAFRQVT